MRRRNLHVGFAALALACVAVTGLQWLELERGQSINGYLARPGTASESEVPIVLLANANALSAGNDLAAASEGYADLIREQAGQPVGQAALFNLGNAYLREALRTGVDSQRGRPLVELAKQRYRDLLREMPQSWDARFNLERALQYAPELAGDDRERKPPVKRVRVITPDFDARDLP